MEVVSYRWAGLCRQHSFMTCANIGSQSFGILRRVLDMTALMICAGSSPAHGLFFAIISLPLQLLSTHRKNAIGVKEVLGAKREPRADIPENDSEREGVGGLGVLARLQRLRRHPLVFIYFCFLFFLSSLIFLIFFCCGNHIN